MITSAFIPDGNESMESGGNGAQVALSTNHFQLNFINARKEESSEAAVASAPGNAKMATTPKRKRSDYWRYYHNQCRKLAPRTIDFDHDAFESVLALLMWDHPGKTEVECIIALAKMELYAPLVGRREPSHKR